LAEATLGSTADPERRPVEVDLHGLRPDQALRRVGQALHAARVRRSHFLLVITGRGIGNRQGVPVLRQAVEAWLRSAEARAQGVRDVRRSRDGGSLEVRLSAPPRTTEER
jgi:DNA-nicking Smr family endonuclease